MALASPGLNHPRIEDDDPSRIVTVVLSPASPIGERAARAI